MKIKNSLGNEADDRTGVHQGKLTTDNFDFRRVLVVTRFLHSKYLTKKPGFLETRLMYINHIR
ncbi:TPA: hypothetical protein U1C26_000646 [Streptococcus suis]|nr:hypothetical protein [Streptococcus suis]